MAFIALLYMTDDTHCTWQPLSRCWN